MLLLGIPAAYALSVHPVRRWQDGLFFFISTKMLPIVAAIGPLYVIALHTHLLDNIWLLIILYTAMNLPLAIWMMRSFMLEVPNELLEAARLDGAGRIREMGSVILPVVLAGRGVDRADLRHLRLERVLPRGQPDHDQRRDRADVPGRRHQHGGPVHRSPVGGGHDRLGAGHRRRLDRPALAGPRPVDGSHQVTWRSPVANVKYVSATRVFGKDATPAVDALDLDIKDGEFMVLVGPSGSGKTTALRMLAGLEPIDSGRVEIGDRDVTDVPPKDRDIAMVFQNYALYPQKTVAENMGFRAQDARRAPRRAGPPGTRGRQAARTRRAAADRKPRQLSGGQRQRVAMGRAIVREPKVFLMDEPLSNLDAKLRVQTRSQIAELQRRLGVTTVYVTHDQVEAMTMGNRVAVLSQGKLQQCDTPRQLYDNPVNQFVAGFIGSPAMNLRTVPLTDGGVRVAGKVLPLPVADTERSRPCRSQGTGYRDAARTPPPRRRHRGGDRRRGSGRRAGGRCTAARALAGRREPDRRPCRGAAAADSRTAGELAHPA